MRLAGTGADAQQSLCWHERRSALVLDQEHEEFRRLGTACVPVNDMNIVGAFIEGLSWCLVSRVTPVQTAMLVTQVPCRTLPPCSDCLATNATERFVPSPLDPSENAIGATRWNPSRSILKR
jgi:hypothetical protein